MNFLLILFIKKSLLKRIIINNFCIKNIIILKLQTGKCITNGGEYPAVLRARRKKCHFVNKLCGGKCTRILKSYTLAECTTPA